MYQSQAQLLDLFGDVNLVHQDGTRFVTNTAHVDVAADTAAGNDPVTGHGPSGDITAQGFRVVDRGNTIIFTGESNLLLKGTKPSAHPASVPPTLPDEVAKTAAALEAAAMAPQTVAPELPVNADPLAGTAPAATPDPASKPRSVAKRDGKLSGGRAPTGGRAKGDAG
jgi:hypothetical protein